MALRSQPNRAAGGARTTAARTVRSAFAVCVALDLTWLVTGGFSGVTRWVATVVVIVAHLTCVLLLRRAPEAVPTSTVVGAVMALAALAAALPAAASRDVWYYAMEGRLLGIHHVNPYRLPPAAFPTDPLLAHVAPGFRSTRGAYGPLFQIGAGLGSLVYGTSALVARLWFQALAAVSLIASVLLLARRRVPAWSLALVGLAPAVLMTVNGAHVDVEVGLGLLIGLLLVRDDRFALAGLAFGLSVLVKASAAPALAAVVVALLLARRWRAARQLSVVAGALIAGGYALFGFATALGPLRTQGDLITRGSFPAWLARFSARAGRATPALASNSSLRTGVAATLALIFFGLFVWRRRRDPDPAELAVGALIVYLLTTNSALAWYPVMVVPALGLVRGRLAAIGLAVLIGFQVLYVAPGSEPNLVPWSLGPAQVAPFASLALLLALVFSPARQTRPAAACGDSIEPGGRS